MKLKPILKGLLTFVPGAERILPKAKTGGTDSAAYCYQVWMKHLVFLWSNGVQTVPTTLAELGPGDSIGTGLSAMLSGVDNYYALDVIDYSESKRNLRIFDELVELFRARSPRPSRGWPDYDEHLDERLFPSHILTEARLAASLSKARVTALRNLIASGGGRQGDLSIEYMVPWSDDAVIRPASVDMILSHSVLEHVVDLETTYRAFRSWIRVGGVMSHQIDFTSHGLASAWNGHWAYPEPLWKLAMGRRLFMINREPVSTHLALMQRNAFEVFCALKQPGVSGIARTQLTGKWNHLSDDDLNCASVFAQARKLSS